MILKKGTTFTVKLSSALAKRGWAGGTFVRQIIDLTSLDTCVDIADGRYCGFFVFGSNESGDQYTSMTQNNVTYGYAVMFWSGNIVYTKTYETMGYMGRNSLGPPTTLVYLPGQPLYVSQNGLITNENESDTGLFPAHDFPNGDPMTPLSFNSFGSCLVAPSALNNSYLMIQTNFDC